MDIKKTLEEIAKEIDKPTREVKAQKVLAKIAMLGAELADEDADVQIPENLLENLNNEMRKLAVLGMLTFIAQGLRQA